MTPGYSYWQKKPGVLIGFRLGRPLPILTSIVPEVVTATDTDTDADFKVLELDR